MKLNNFWGTTRSPGLQVGMIVRLGLALTAIAGSIALAWVLLGGHYDAHAGAINTLGTADQPMGLVIDKNGNAWIAEPNCNPAPVCSAPAAGAIEEFKLSGSGGLVFVARYLSPATPQQYNPTFLTVDASGNIWFTDPTNNLIGKLVPGAHPTWTKYTTGLSASAEPFGIITDKNGKIWFAERGISKIGFIDPTVGTPTIHENGGFTANSQPFGLTMDNTGTIWFTEDTVANLGTFTPTTNGTVTIHEHPTGTGANLLPAHMISADKTGNLWYSEGGTDQVGEYTISGGATKAYNVAPGICPTPGATPTTCSNTFISGVAADSTGKIWFDESQTDVLGLLNPTTGAISAFKTTAHYPGEGLVVDGANNVWVSMLFGQSIDELAAGSVPTPTPTNGSPTPSGSPVPNLPPGPVFKTWYFAEGHIGATFQEYLTVQNPDPVNSCAVSFQYLLSTGAQTPINVTVGPNTRWTENVNQDLNVQRNGTFAEDVSTIVTVNNTTTPNCTGVVAERPMYFSNLFGASSGHDALGATHLGSSFYFPDVASFPGYRDFITILNPPGGSAATITVNYYKGGTIVGTDTKTVQPGTRGTISPINLSTHVAAFVQSTQPVDVELPSYFSNFVAGNAGVVNGAAVVVGAPSVSNDWRFAEGYIGGKFQEDVVLANFSNTAVNATMVLEYDTGTTLTVSTPIGAEDYVLEDINYITAHASTVGTCSSPCNLSSNISIEVSAPSGSNFVAERELYFQYNHAANGRILNATGGTAVLGQSGTAATTSYSFAEGYTNTYYDEWLTIQNPTTSTETIWVTLVNGFGSRYSFPITVGPKTRATNDLVHTVLSNMCTSGAPSQCWEISMTVQTINNGGAFVAERPMYFNASGSQGGTVVIGYIGG